MARVVFTQHLATVAPVTEAVYDGATVAEVLGGAFADHPQLKGYICDDQGRVRRHIAIFVDGALQDRGSVLALPVTAGSEVYVLQALSGG